MRLPPVAYIIFVRHNTPLVRRRCLHVDVRRELPSLFGMKILVITVANTLVSTAIVLPSETGNVDAVVPEEDCVVSGDGRGRVS